MTHLRQALERCFLCPSAASEAAKRVCQQTASMGCLHETFAAQSSGEPGLQQEGLGCCNVYAQ